MIRDISVRPGVKVTLDIDDETGDATLRHSQDVQDILDAAARERANASDWRAWKGTLGDVGAVKVCSLSPVHQLELAKQGIVSLEGGFKILDERRFQRWLDELSGLKSTPGRAFNV